MFEDKKRKLMLLLITKQTFETLKLFKIRIPDCIRMPEHVVL